MCLVLFFRLDLDLGKSPSLSPLYNLISYIVKTHIPMYFLVCCHAKPYPFASAHRGGAAAGQRDNGTPRAASPTVAGDCFCAGTNAGFSVKIMAYRFLYGKTTPTGRR
jgi:hypothetical protein